MIIPGSNAPYVEKSLPPRTTLSYALNAAHPITAPAICVKANALLQISTALLRHGSRLKKKPHKKTRKHRARMKSAVHAVESPIPAKRFSATTAVSRSPVARLRRRPTLPQAGFPHSRAFLRKIQPEGLRTARRPLRVPFRAHLAPPLSF